MRLLKARCPERTAWRRLRWLTLLAGLVACHHPEPDYSVWHAQQREVLARPADGIARIALDNVNGGILVWTSENDSITVEVVRYASGLDSADAETYLQQVLVRDSVASGTLCIRSTIGDPGPRALGSEFFILAPESIAVGITAESGDASVERRNARLGVAVNRGNVTTWEHAGSIFIRSTAGNVQCDVAHLAPDDSIQIETNTKLTASVGTSTLALPGDVSARFDAEVTTPLTENVFVDSFADLHFTLNRDEHKVGSIGAGEASIRITSVEHIIFIENRDNWTPATPAYSSDLGTSGLRSR